MNSSYSSIRYHKPNYYGSVLDPRPYAGAYAITDLELLISEFNVNDDFNVQVHITATPVADNHGRMPAEGEYDGGSQTCSPSRSMVSIDLVRADSVITVWLNAIHEVLIGKDHHMGAITCLEAAYARDKRSLFLEPVRSNPFNPYIRNHLDTKPERSLNPATAGESRHSR